MARRGIFITFEGVDGSGKTTQVQRLAAALEPNVILTREPGGTPISERIRDIFLTSDGITTMTELLLIAAARAQHVDERIRPHWQQIKLLSVTDLRMRLWRIKGIGAVLTLRLSIS